MQKMQDQELYDYFLREMDYLRMRAKSFADDYPDVAKELRLSEVKSSDPHVELLLQSFAYLSANVRRDMATQANHLPNQVLGVLYPHLIKPIPSMFVVQADVVSKEAKFDGVKVLDKGREFYVDIHSSKKGLLRCKMTTSTKTTLRPFDVSDVSFSSIRDVGYDASKMDNDSVSNAVRKAHTALKLEVTNLDDKPTAEFGPESLRFYINGEKNRPHSAYHLYDLIANDCINIIVKNRSDSEASQYQLLNKNAISWVGFDEEDAVLPFNKGSHSAYRILQEYFLFPEKYLFFDLTGIDGSKLGKKFDIYFLLSTLPNQNVRPNADSFSLNAIPLINLYPQRLNSIRLDEEDHEYRLMGDFKHHAYCEVHSLSEVQVIPKEGEPKRAQPYAGIEGDLLHENECFYSTRTEISGLKSVPGTEMYISIHQKAQEYEKTADDVISIKAKCTNRRLPESLRVGDSLALVGPGPISRAKVLTKPTMHMSPSLNNDKPWRLMSNLVLNTSSLEKEGIEILKSILLTYSNENEKSHFSQVDSITDVQCRRIVKHIGKDQWRGLCKGMEVVLEIDIEKFNGTSLHLFGSVLNRFFGLYANVNSFTQFKLILKQKKEVFRSWPPLAGEQILL